MRYNRHLCEHFKNCRLLKIGHDPHRNRRVEIRFIPGEFEVVGMTDGVEAWVAPLATGFLEDVRKMLAELQKTGKFPEAVVEPEKRRKERVRIQLDEPEVLPPKRERVRISL